MAKAEARPKMKGHGKIRRMSIEPAHGGFTSTIEHQQPANGSYMGPSTPTIHPSVSHLVKHIKNTFGGEGAPTPPSPTSEDEGAEAGETAGS